MRGDILSNLKDQLAIRLDDCLEKMPTVCETIVHQYFTAVRLDNGPIGVSFKTLKESQTVVPNSSPPTMFAQENTYTLDQCWEESSNWSRATQLSFRSAVLCAYADLLFATNNIQVFPGGLRMNHLTQKGDTVTIVGLGGPINGALIDQNISKLFISDASIENSPKIQREVKQFEVDFPHLNIEVSSGVRTEEFIKQSHVVCLTASTITNGTLDPLLASTRQCREVLLDGFSAPILPDCLFELGVSALNVVKFLPSTWETIRNWSDKNQDKTFPFLLPQLEFEVVGFRKSGYTG